MKKKFAGSLLSALGLMLTLSGSVWAAPDGITVTLTSPQTEYIPGQNNTFTFDVGLAYTGAEYVDRYQFVFPAGVTIVSATPASGAGGCGSNAGIQSICGSTVAWGNPTATCSGPFTPTGCGVYNAANSSFTVTAGVPMGFTGPMAVTLNSVGDGFGLPAGTPDSDAVSFAQGGGVTVVAGTPAGAVTIPPRTLPTASATSTLSFTASAASTTTCVAAGAGYSVSPSPLSLPAATAASVTVTQNSATAGTYAGTITCTNAAGATPASFVYDFTHDVIAAPVVVGPAAAIPALNTLGSLALLAGLGLFGVFAVRRFS